MITYVAVGQGASMPWMRSFFWPSSKRSPFDTGLPVPHPCASLGDLSVTISHSGPKLSSQTLLLLFLAISYQGVTSCVRTKIFWILIIENCASIHIKYVYLHLVISHGWREKGDEIGCGNKGMERLIKWMPDVDSVTKFDLSSSKAISPDAIKKVN